jgi:hypothetical protein
MIRATLLDLTFRLFTTKDEAIRVAKVFNPDLTSSTFYRHKDFNGLGYIFVLDGTIYDTDGNVTRYMKKTTNDDYLKEFFEKDSD